MILPSQSHYYETSEMTWGEPGGRRLPDGRHWGGAASLLLLPHLPAAELAPASTARQLLLTGRYEEAATAYGKSSQSGAVANAIGLARCQVATGKLDRAEQTLREAAERNAQAADLYAELAKLMFARGRHESAAELVKQALELDHRQFTAHWIAAELDRVAGKLDEAQKAYAWFIDEYNAAETLTAEQLHHIGLAAAQYARWKRNSDQFQHLVNTLYPDARKLEPQYWPAHLEAALLFLEKYNAADAKAELDAALAINPNAAEVHAARARLALQDFDLVTAQTAIDRALAINPQLLAAHQCRADSLLAELRPAEALAVLEQARELNPLDEQTLGRLAAAYGAVDGLKPIAADSRLAKLTAQVAACNPHCGEFYLALAESLDRMRRYPAAVEYAREADRRMPQLLYARGLWGLLDMRLGREAEAEKTAGGVLPRGPVQRPRQEHARSAGPAPDLRRDRDRPFRDQIRPQSRRGSGSLRGPVSGGRSLPAGRRAIGLLPAGEVAAGDLQPRPQFQRPCLVQCPHGGPAVCRHRRRLRRPDGGPDLAPRPASKVQLGASAPARVPSTWSLCNRPTSTFRTGTPRRWPCCRRERPGRRPGVRPWPAAAKPARS